MMESVINAAFIAGPLLVAGLALALIRAFVLRRINVEGMASGSKREASLSRLSGIWVTLGAALVYVGTTLRADLTKGVIPDVPENMLWILAASGGLYLGGKNLPFSPTSMLLDLLKILSTSLKRRNPDG